MTAALDHASIEYVVVGSTAAAAWGVVRSTRDIDLVTLVSARSIPQLVAQLEGDDLYVPFTDLAEAFTSGGSFNVLHPASGGKVDVFVCRSDDEFEQTRLSRRVAMEVFGIDTWVATVEDVILSKLRWRRDSRSEIQWRDCIELVAIQDIDRDYLVTWADHLGVAVDLESLLNIADEASTGEPDR